MKQCSRDVREPPAAILQREVEDQVFAVGQPFRISARLLPRCLPEGNGSARRQKSLGLDFVRAWVIRRTERDLEQGAWRRLGMTAGDVRLTSFDRGDDALQPVLVQNQARVGAGDDRVARVPDRVVAARRDVVASVHEPDRMSPLDIVLDDLRGRVAAAAIVDHDLVGRTGLRKHRVKQRGDAACLVAHGRDQAHSGWLGELKGFRAARGARSVMTAKSAPRTWDRKSREPMVPRRSTVSRASSAGRRSSSQSRRRISNPSRRMRLGSWPARSKASRALRDRPLHEPVGRQPPRRDHVLHAGLRDVRDGAAEAPHAVEEPGVLAGRERWAALVVAGPLPKPPTDVNDERVTAQFAE